jgi:hypothetical protein
VPVRIASRRSGYYARAKQVWPAPVSIPPRESTCCARAGRCGQCSSACHGGTPMPCRRGVIAAVQHLYLASPSNRVPSDRQGKPAQPFSGALSQCWSRNNACAAGSLDHGCRPIPRTEARVEYTDYRRRGVRSAKGARSHGRRVRSVISARQEGFVWQLSDSGHRHGRHPRQPQHGARMCFSGSFRRPEGGAETQVHNFPTSRWLWRMVVFP